MSEKTTAPAALPCPRAAASPAPPPYDLPLCHDPAARADVCTGPTPDAAIDIWVDVLATLVLDDLRREFECAAVPADASRTAAEPGGAA